MSDWKAKLKALGPCPEAYRWAIKHKTLREAWRMCERGDWMGWLAVGCGDGNIMQAVWVAFDWFGLDHDTPDHSRLVRAYIILDFMPDPPRLPEIT